MRITGLEGEKYPPDCAACGALVIAGGARRCRRSGRSFCTLGWAGTIPDPLGRAQRRVGTCLAARQFVLVSAATPRVEAVKVGAGCPPAPVTRGQDAKRRGVLADDARHSLSVICRYRRGGRQLARGGKATKRGAGCFQAVL